MFPLYTIVLRGFVNSLPHSSALLLALGLLLDLLLIGLVVVPTVLDLGHGPTVDIVCDHGPVVAILTMLFDENLDLGVGPCTLLFGLKAFPTTSDLLRDTAWQKLGDISK